MKDLPASLPDGSVPEARPSALPVRHLTDALPPVQRAWDAWAVVHPAEAAGERPALADARYAGKLVAPARVVPARDGSALRELVQALCKPAAVQSAA